MSAVLNIILLLPLLGAIAVLLIPRSRERTVEWTAFLASAAALVLSIFLWYQCSSGDGGIQFAQEIEWIPEFHIQYSIGVDGFSMPMILLTTLLSTVCIFYSFGRVKSRVKEYYFFMLLLCCFLEGVFAARDLFLFFVLFDASLVPMYFLIALWGGEKRAYASMRFLLYTLAGSAVMLIGLLWVYFQSAAVSPAHEPTFDIAELAKLNVFASAPGLMVFNHPIDAQVLLFFLFGVAFAVKIPIFPLHTWLPDAYVEAPTAATAMLAGAMGKMGAYGFLRIALPLFPAGAHAWATPLMVLGVISIIYGALVALAQWDIKRLVAYSSVSHMGFIALGIASAAAVTPVAGGPANDHAQTALSGVLFEMFGHGIITGGLFLMVGMLAERTGIRDLRALTGAMKRAPIYVVLFSVVMFASMGMPGLMGFWGELYILLGSFQVYALGTALSALGIAVTAGFFIWALQRMAFGVTSPASETLIDIRGSEWRAMFPLFILMLLFGILPGLFLSPWLATINQLIQYLGR